MDLSLMSVEEFWLQPDLTLAEAEPCPSPGVWAASPGKRGKAQPGLLRWDIVPFCSWCKVSVK